MPRAPPFWRCAAWVACAALALGRAAAREDLSCRGHKYGGIDWDGLRGTLEIYADKYLDRPQLLAYEFKVSGQYATGYHPANDCVLGDICLRLLLWLGLAAEDLVSTVSSLSVGEPALGTGQLVDETYRWFWDLPYSWSDILSSGWPVFSLLASAAEVLYDPRAEACLSDSVIERYRAFFGNAVYTSMSEDLDTLRDAGHCADAAATALFSLADKQRHDAPAHGNPNYRFTSMPVLDQPADTTVSDLVTRAQEMLSDAQKWGLLTTRWPVWRYLDRLSATEVVRVSSGVSTFLMYVFPHRVLSDGIISNRIRATASAYCHKLFQSEVRRLMEHERSRGKPMLRLVEAGPHIGDCMLWAASEFGDSVHGTAVEPVQQVVERFRRSIAVNDFDIDLRHAWLGNQTTAPSRAGEAPWLRIDDIVHAPIDVLKIHTNGGERSILEGATSVFTELGVKIVILHSAEEEEMWNCIVFLLQRGYRVSFADQLISYTDELSVRRHIREHGGSQVHAVL